MISLLLLPMLGLWLSGTERSDFLHNGLAYIVNPPAVLLTTLLFAGYLTLINHLVKLLTGNSPFHQQRNYFLWMGAASIVLIWLLAYLNLYVANWTTQPENPFMQFLLYTPMFAMLVPAVLITRALLGASGTLLKLLSRGIALPALKAETRIFIMIPLAALGLAGGAAWPEELFWLFWIAPLLLLAGLQLLWNEGTIFTDLTSGNWGRVICAALAGIIVGNFVVAAYRYNGGIINTSPGILFGQFGYAAFGLLCLQLGDVIAENWRGTTRGEQLKKHNKFPIPVITRKS